MMHEESHPLAGQTVHVKLKAPHFQLDGLEHEFVLEDWWDVVSGKPWMLSDGNPAALIYAMRLTHNPDPIASMGMMDDEVVYGHIGPFGHLIHTSELVVN